MPFAPILAGVIAITGFAEAAVTIDLWSRRASLIQHTAFLPFVGTYVFCGLWASLLLGFYSGPDSHGADLSEADVVVANLLLGGILVLVLRSCRLSVVARRCLFYAFTLPAWMFLLSLAWSGILVRR